MSLTVRGLNFAYPAGKPVLQEASLSAPAGEITALVGPNGSGKSTLLKCINGILPPRDGTVRFDGTDMISLDPLRRARLMSYVPQSIPGTLNLKVMDVVLLGRRPYIRWGVGKEDRRIVYRTLEQVGLEKLTFRPYDELSGGQKQKVLIARALAQQPRLLIMDEPTSSLDLGHQLEVLTLVRGIARKKNLCVLLTAHDLNLVMNFADRLVMLRDGRIFHDGLVDDVLNPASVQDVFGVDTYVGNHRGTRFITPVLDPADS